MLRVGLTGGIGAGKSTVSARLAALGAVVIDADLLAREVVARGTDGLDEILAAFGPEVLTDAGELDRQAMAKLVFADEDARARLNAIVHPRVAVRTGELIAAAPSDAIVVHDVPLLVENGLAPGYHLVLVVDAPVEQRVARLIELRGMPEGDARARITAQASTEQRKAAADVWLDNGGSREDLLAAVDALWTDRLVPFAANVRTRTRAVYGSVRVVEYDPTWPAQAARLSARIGLAAGAKALRIDHIGSTSVPGLAAKDVIDLQLTVVSLDDADAIADSLSDAGFPVRPDITGDNPKPADPDPEHWRKRFHNSADPGRPVNLHLRAAGSPGWRYALMFRDWLRAEPEPREEYQALKLRLAMEHDDYGSYADAKEPWFDKALPEAEAWAARTNWVA